MASRQSKRAGFGVLKGSLNSKITISLVVPPHPQIKEIWIDMLASKMYWWDGVAWVKVIT